MEFIQKLSNYHKASYYSLFVLTHEEGRFIRELTALRETNPEVSIHEWDAQNGLICRTAPKVINHPEETKTTAYLLEYLQNFNQEDSIFVLKDFHLHFDKVINIRLLRNAWNKLKRKRNMIVFVGHKFSVPGELTKEIQLMDYTLPDTAAIQERLFFIRDSVNKELTEAGKEPIQIEPSVVEASIEAAKGMTHMEVENAFAMAFVTAHKFDNVFVEAVFQEKIAQLKKNGLLTYMEPNISFENVGGMGGLKKWLTARKKAYSQSARDYKLPLPKGMLLASVPGTGNIIL